MKIKTRLSGWLGALLVATLPGSAAASLLFQEDFSGATPGANKTGVIAGTQVEVTHDAVDIVGVLNGSFFGCVNNPTGNCLDLVGSPGLGAIQSIPTFNLVAGHTYTVSFGVVLQGFDPGDSATSQFTVGLGSFSQQLTAIPAVLQASLDVTPAGNESNVPLTFTTNTEPDTVHGAVLDHIVLTDQGPRAVPEPSAIVALGPALAGFAVIGRRRNRREARSSVSAP